MGLLAVLAGYIGFLGAFLFVMLFGESPMFEGTLLHKAHWLITSGICECFQKVLGSVFGKRGEQAFDLAGDVCCNRPNPVLQLFYLGLLAGAYYFFGDAIFPYIPGTYISPMHRYFGPGLVLICLATFYLTSCVDPGVISKANVQKHLKSFPYDGVIYKEKICTTCDLIRPARAKHCTICDCCIARFDHHCGWMNNCIGERNVRFFIAFLLGHTLLCWYGVGLVIALLAGEIHDRALLGAMETSGEFPPGTGMGPQASFILQWLLIHYGVHVMLCVFAFIISLLLAGFSAYHLYLICKNTTTNETFKWADYRRWRSRELTKSAASDAPSDSIEQASPLQQWKWLGLQRRKKAPQGSRPAAVVTEARNIYNKGMWLNFYEVFLPPSTRTQ